MRWIRVVVLAASAVLVLGFVAAVGVVFTRPELMPSGPYHPRAIYCKLLGYPVHPWVRVDPAKRFTLRVWSTRWPIFREGYGYDDLIDEAAAEFRRTHPNVDVEYVLLRLDEIGPAIAAACANTTPPDICMAPFDPSLVESGLVVPLDVFMRGKEAGDAAADSFDLRALGPLALRGRVWAWPAWTSMQSWAGNAQILREAGVDVERVMTLGWSYDDVLAMVRAVAARQAGMEERYRTYGLVLDAASMATLDTLMRAAGRGLALACDGSLAWQGAPLLSVLSFLEQAREERAFPEPASRMGGLMLELFWNGRAAVIGPVGPGFARHVRERRERVAEGKLPYAFKGVEPVLLPIPHPPGGAANPCVSVRSAMVFRHPGRGGEDAARLAVEFARLLARKEALWLARELCVVPAHLADRKQVRGTIGPDGASERFLLAAASSGAVCSHTSAALAQKEREIRERVIAPALSEFWKGSLAAGDFDAHVRKGLPGGAPESR